MNSSTHRTKMMWSLQSAGLSSTYTFLTSRILIWSDW